VNTMLRRLLPLLLLLALAACSSKIELYNSLKARDANEMLALLMRNGIDAEKVVDDGGLASLMVDKEQLPQAMEVLTAAGLPHQHFAELGDLFKKEGMISSPTEERVRYLYGITQELSLTLTTIDGVLSARVHVVLPEEMGDSTRTKPSSAAVLIRYAPGAAIDQVVPKIKELVANSLEGVLYDRVSVVLVKSTPDDALLHPVLAADAGSSTENPRLLYGLAAAFVASLIGNIALVSFLWRNHRMPLAASSAAPVTT
jgi:type III secretion protein J